MFVVGREPANSGELVDLAYSDPERVARLAAAMLDRPGLAPADRCRALWALGLARRELGDAERAAEALELGRVAALEAGEPATAGRVATTLALSRSQLGEPAEALRLLDEAEPALAGADRGHLQLQRGLILMYEERVDEALGPMLDALAIFDAEGDRLAVARTHLNAGVICGALHRHAEALDHAERATGIAAELGRGFLSAQARHNVGYAAYRLGDVPRALREMAAAEGQLRSLEAAPLVLATILQDRALVKLEAHLVEEAATDSRAALVAAEAGSNALVTAEATLLAARCQLAAGALDGAAETARLAARRLRQAGRPTWTALADLIALQAAVAGGEPVGADVAVAVATALAGRRWWNEAATAALLAASVLTASDDRDRATAVLARLRRQPLGSTALERSAAALVRARFHELRGDDRSARAAVTSGLHALTGNLAAIGAMEVRAHAVAHGTALAEVGMRLARRDGRARELLARAELGRGAASQLGRVRPYRDPELSVAMARFRDLTRQIHEELDAGRSPGGLVEARLATEALIQDRSRRTRSDGGGRGTDDVGAAVRALGPRALLEFVQLDGELQVVAAESGRTRLVELGRPQIGPVLDQLMLGLARLNRARSSAASCRAAEASIDDAGATLAELLLPPGFRIPAEGVVIVPSGDLHGIPWAALPPLRRCAVSVVPSLLAWHRGAARATPPAATLGLAAGPGLHHADREIAELAAVDGRCERLDSTSASVQSVTDLLGRVDVVHLACHGVFRADNPMFSALRLADGDLTVYDLEALDRLPAVVVLSACDVGRSGVLPGQALLGLTSALLQLGVTSVVAPLTPVNDERTVEVMRRLHRGIAGGLPAADSLARARFADSDRHAAAALSFVSFGR